MTEPEASHQTRGEKKYEAVRVMLECARPNEDIVLSFAHIESLIGSVLPARARTDPLWWASTPYQPQSRSWLRVDRRADVDLNAETVAFVSEIFERNNSLSTIRGLRRRELSYARDTLRYSPDERHIELGWWEPHTVYVLHFQSSNQYKVGVARVGSRRITNLTGRAGELIDGERVGNLWAAKVVEQQVLEMMEVAWVRPDRLSTGKGGETERWADWLVPPRLSAVMDCLAMDRAAPSWSLSVMRIGEDTHRTRRS